MRISTQSQINMMKSSIADNMATINKMSEQFNSGKRVDVPSDDPIASTLFLQVESENLKIEQHSKNLNSVKSNVELQEANIESVDNLLDSIKKTLIQLAPTTNSPDDIKSFVQSIESKMDSLVTMLNKKNMEGRYLYSGTETSTEPVEFDAIQNKYVYHGNESIRENIVGDGVTEKDTVLLHQIFSVGNEQMKVLNDLKELCTTLKNGSATPTTPADIQDMLKSIEGAANQLDSISGDLINRKENLAILQTAQKQIMDSNIKFGQNLIGMEVTERYMLLMQMAQYKDAIRGTMQTHAKMAQLSIFNYMS